MALDSLREKVFKVKKFEEDKQNQLKVVVEQKAKGTLVLIV